MAVIRASGVSKSYGDIDAVDDIFLTIDRGEIYGFLGPNGAGKTTTIEMLTGQTRPDTGTVSVLDIDSVAEPVAARAKMGILPERESPPSFLTPREYFELVGDIRGLDADTVTERIAEWGERLSFTDQLDTLHTDLSRGQQQKVMITQAFIHQPDVVIIDEPLVNLDPIMQERVKELFVEYADDNRTILLSTHDISVAEEICTRVGIIQNGDLREEISLADTDTETDLLSVFKETTDEETAMPGVTEGV